MESYKKSISKNHKIFFIFQNSDQMDANWNSHGASSSILFMQGARLHFLSNIS